MPFFSGDCFYLHLSQLISLSQICTLVSVTQFLLVCMSLSVSLLHLHRCTHLLQSRGYLDEALGTPESTPNHNWFLREAPDPEWTYQNHLLELSFWPDMNGLRVRI